MCMLCVRAKAATTHSEKEEQLEALAAMLKNVNEPVPEHYDQAMDILLGTDTPDEDQELAQAWENSHRE